MLVTTYLIADHHRLDALLQQAAASHPFDGDAFARFRAGLLRHIAIEEKVLFPAARRARGGDHLSRAHDLRVEHAALSSLLVTTPDNALCGELQSILVGHNAVEEGPGGVYEECEALLSAEQSRQLGAEATDFRSIPVAPYFDSPRAYRTAATALAAARRMKRRR